MAITDEARHQLYKAMEEAIGMAHASTLMASLPPAGWGDVATKRDLELVEARFEAKLERSIRELQRNLFFGLATMQLAFAGVVLGLVR